MWEIVHAAVSRRLPISLYTIVARTHMYTYAATVWDLTIVQDHFHSPRSGMSFSVAASPTGACGAHYRRAAHRVV